MSSFPVLDASINSKGSGTRSSVVYAQVAEHAVQCSVPYQLLTVTLECFVGEGSFADGYDFSAQAVQKWGEDGLDRPDLNPDFYLGTATASTQAVGVEKGTLAGNAMMDFTTARPGRVWVGIVDSNGINGNGSLVVVSFQEVGQGAATGQLTLENVEAYDAQTLIDIITQATPGNLSTPPTIIFNP